MRIIPWHIEKQGARFCVIKDDDGANEGCHSSRAKARRQMAALYANEPGTEARTMGDLGYAYRSGEFVFRSAEGEHGVLEGKLLPYGEWARIDSIVEGRFYERFMPRSITKTLQERGSRLRVLFEHGLSSLTGKMPIAEFESFRDQQDGVYYTARLLSGLPELFLDGLRKGVYGASVRHKPVKADVDRRPGKSAHNPEGWEERSIREALLKEFSVVTFPAFASTSAGVRSLTDDFFRARVEEDPGLLLQLVKGETEPSHSEPAEPDTEPEEGEEEEGEDTGSRDTQPETEPAAKAVKDWLAPTERKEGWLPQ